MQFYDMAVPLQHLQTVYIRKYSKIHTSLSPITLVLYCKHSILIGMQSKTYNNAAKS